MLSPTIGAPGGEYTLSMTVRIHCRSSEGDAWDYLCLRTIMSDLA